MVSVGLFGRRPHHVERGVVGEPRDVAVRRSARRDHRALVRIGQTLDVVQDALVPAADVERVVVGPVGQAALGGRRPRERAGDRLDHRAGVRVPAVDSVVAAHIDLAHQVADGVVGHVAAPVPTHGVGQFRPVRRAQRRELVVAVVGRHVGEPHVARVADAPGRGDPVGGQDRITLPGAVGDQPDGAAPAYNPSVVRALGSYPASWPARRWCSWTRRRRSPGSPRSGAGCRCCAVSASACGSGSAGR